MSLDEKRPYHEKWAEGWETYLFEGQAPSIEMGRIFRAFSEAMKKIYVSLRNLNVQLKDEIRGVFDRMLASDQAIQEMRNARNIANLLVPEGATTAEVAEAKSAEQEMIETAAEALARRSLRDMRWLSNAKSAVLSKLQSKADEARNKIREEEAAAMAQEPVWQAVAAMKKPGGKMDAKLVEGMTLLESEKKAIAPYLVKTNGIHPDIVAAEHGFIAGQELISEIANAREKKVSSTSPGQY